MGMLKSAEAYDPEIYDDLCNSEVASVHNSTSERENAYGVLFDK